MMILLMLLSFLELDNMNRSNFDKKADDLEKVSNMQVFDEYEFIAGIYLDLNMAYRPNATRGGCPSGVYRFCQVTENKVGRVRSDS